MREARGFTLLEIILASAVAVIVGIFLLAILVNNTGFFYKQKAIVGEGLDLNDALGEIESQIKRAASVAVSYPEVSPVYITDSETLVLKLPSLSAQGSLEGVYDFVVITKDSSNPQILRQQVFPDPQSTRVSSNSVLTTILKSSEFKFFDKAGNEVSPVTAVSVGTILTLSSKTGSIGSERSASASTTLRNAP